jgi:uncharacterized protein (DUF2237 family)
MAVKFNSVNVFGEPLIACSAEPITGFFRDGCCNTNEQDEGEHWVCVVVSKSFLEYSYEKGNDLITPRPMWNFPGLKDGDRWCICASRWMQAHEAGAAPMVVLEATHEKLLEYISLEKLVKYASK